MPFKLRKCPNKDLFWVVGPDGKHHSKEGMPKNKAEAQLRILNAAVAGEQKGAGDKWNPYEYPDAVVVPNTPFEEAINNILNPDEPGNPIPPNPTEPIRTPSLYTLLQMSMNARSDNPAEIIDGWYLVTYTVDLKFYTKGNIGIVAVRGTHTNEDWSTNSLIPYNRAIEGNRVQRDIRNLKDIQKKLASRVTEWYGVGHSLGGAICDIFIDLKLITAAVSFNPAIEPQYKNSDKNRRYYHADDPLYYYLAKDAKVEHVLPGQTYSWYDWGSWAIPWTDLDYGALWAHKLDRFVDYARSQGDTPMFSDANEPDNFSDKEDEEDEEKMADFSDVEEDEDMGVDDARQGGARGSGNRPMAKLATHLEELGIDPHAYLEEARRKARAAGLAWRLLGWAEDDTHKLQIPNEEGRLIQFGAAGMGDHILYSLMKDKSAAKHRRAYRARATKIKGDWWRDRYSPGSLALTILW